jgi:thermostable 8-oxoguanine DNA glycosylase
LEQEVVFCLLGGFGVTAEVAHAAHRAVMPLLTVGDEPDAAAIEMILRQPLRPDGGRYRFPHQRATRVAAAVRELRSTSIPVDPAELHRRLLQLPGVGLKTAAWIMRNHTGSDDFAIIDIWIVRSLTRNGVFRSDWNVRQHYSRYESTFLSYAEQGRVRPAALDACIWEQARRAGLHAI